MNECNGLDSGLREISIDDLQAFEQGTPDPEPIPEDEFHQRIKNGEVFPRGTKVKFDYTKPVRIVIGFDGDSETPITGPLIPDQSERVRAFLRELNPEASSELLDECPSNYVMTAAGVLRSIASQYTIDGATAAAEGLPSDVSDPDLVPDGLLDRIHLHFARWAEPFNAADLTPVMMNGEITGYTWTSSDIQRFLHHRLTDSEWRKTAFNGGSFPAPRSDENPDGAAYIYGSALSGGMYRDAKSESNEPFDLLVVVGYVPASEVPWLNLPKEQAAISKPASKRIAHKPFGSYGITNNSPIPVLCLRALAQPDKFLPSDSSSRTQGKSVFCDTYDKGNVDFTLMLAEETLKILRNQTALVIKTHFAFWTRIYAETGGDTGKRVMMTIPQLCRDLGFKPHHSGSFKKETKDRVIQAAQVLFDAQIAVEYLTRGKNRLRQRIRGPLWHVGLVAETYYEDLWSWEASAFLYSPGSWFEDPAWQETYKSFGVYGAGLLKLDSNRDEWAIRIGAYLVTMCRIKQYKSFALGVETIIENAGLSGVDSHNPARVKGKLERALKRLVEVGVIQEWSYRSSALNQKRKTPSTDFRKQLIDLKWSEHLEVQAKKVKEAQEKKSLPAQRQSRGKNVKTAS